MAESDILEALKAMQLNLEGKITASNQAFSEFTHSIEMRFAELHNPIPMTGTNLAASSSFRPPDPPSSPEILPVLRSMKMGIPRFDGSDPHGWVFFIEEFFYFHFTPESVHLLIVSFHMDIRAAFWFQWIKANGLLTTWSEFLTSLIERFRSTLFEDPQGALSKLSQTGSMAEF